MKIVLVKFVVWTIFLYGVQEWSVTKSDRIEAFEMWGWKKTAWCLVMRTSYKQVDIGGTGCGKKVDG